MTPARRHRACIRRERHVLQLPKRCHRRSGPVIFDHEIMHHETAARRETIERVFDKPRDFRSGDAAEQIGHQNRVLFFRPFGRQGVRRDIADAIDHSGAGNELPTDFRYVWEVDNG